MIRILAVSRVPPKQNPVDKFNRILEDKEHAIVIEILPGEPLDFNMPTLKAGQVTQQSRIEDLEGPNLHLRIIPLSTLAMTADHEFLLCEAIFDQKHIGYLRLPIGFPSGTTVVCDGNGNFSGTPKITYISKKNSEAGESFVIEVPKKHLVLIEAGAVN